LGNFLIVTLASTDADKTIQDVKSEIRRLVNSSSLAKSWKVEHITLMEDELLQLHH
jgi:DNA-dependent RNA polymerase auxiliary subunit epsilon